MAIARAAMQRMARHLVAAAAAAPSRPLTVSAVAAARVLVRGVSYGATPSPDFAPATPSPDFAPATPSPDGATATPSPASSRKVAVATTPSPSVGPATPSSPDFALATSSLDGATAAPSPGSSRKLVAAATTPSPNDLPATPSPNVVAGTFSPSSSRKDAWVVHAAEAADGSQFGPPPPPAPKKLLMPPYRRFLSSAATTTPTPPPPTAISPRNVQYLIDLLNGLELTKEDELMFRQAFNQRFHHFKVADILNHIEAEDFTAEECIFLLKIIESKLDKKGLAQLLSPEDINFDETILPRLEAKLDILMKTVVEGNAEIIKCVKSSNKSEWGTVEILGKKLDLSKLEHLKKLIYYILGGGM